MKYSLLLLITWFTIGSLLANSAQGQANETAQPEANDATLAEKTEEKVSPEEPEGEQADSTPTFGESWQIVWNSPGSSLAEKCQASINLVFDQIVVYLYAVLFFEVPIGYADKTMPLIILTLLSGGIFFTLRYSFVNIRMFRHCLDVIRGLYDRPEDEGEVSHFQALTSALSATVGLGNIASVAVAISLGGPGAVFWMWVVAFLGMSMKFTSCSLAQYYRRVKPDGSVLGGPMIYLDDGFKQDLPALAPLGKLLALVYAGLTIMAAFGGGNMFQGNQAFSIIQLQFGVPSDMAWLVGLLMSVLVGVVIIGGIRRIGEVTSKLVPMMCGLYCLVCLVILLMHAVQIPTVFGQIFSEAFSSEAAYGGFFGALLMGARRAAFSNEAGLGSAAIAHAAAKTDEPIREGIVAMIGPFIDTIVVCTMTALAILITGAHLDPVTGAPFAVGSAQPEGVEITAKAFLNLGPALPYFLCLAVFIFAYSTMISWSYYGERAVEYLFGQRGIKPYRIVYLLFVILGPILSLKAVLDFSDMMLLSMSFPNIIGMILLSALVSSKSRDYISRLKSGAMKQVVQ
jgi:AGCS family alanine or glycine:cation symporter